MAGHLREAMLAGAIHAQPFPAKTIEFNVHTAPGGGTDLFARTVTDILSKEKIIAQPIIVSNRPGGSGAIAFNHIKSKRGDPHVVLTMATGSFLTATVRGGDAIDGAEPFGAPLAKRPLPGIERCRRPAPYKTPLDENPPGA